MSEVVVKPPVTLASLLQNELFKPEHEKDGHLGQEQLRECRDLYLKAQFTMVITKLYEYEMLQESASEYAVDAWTWLFTAVGGLQSFDGLSQDVVQQLTSDFSRPFAEIASLRGLGVFEREQAFLGYARAAMRICVLQFEKQEQFLKTLDCNICSELGNIIPLVHSEEEIRGLAKAVNLYVFDVQILLWNKRPSKSLYTSLCRNFPALASKLSSSGPDRHKPPTWEQQLLSRLASKSPKTKASPKRIDAVPTEPPPKPEHPTPKSQQLRTENTLKEDYQTTSKEGSLAAPYRYSFIPIYLPTWLTGFTNARLLALLVMVLITLRKTRMFRFLLNYGILTLRQIVDILTGI